MAAMSKHLKYSEDDQKPNISGFQIFESRPVLENAKTTRAYFIGSSSIAPVM